MLPTYPMQVNTSYMSMSKLEKYKNGAAELKDLIEQVLHHPDFDPS